MNTRSLPTTGKRRREEPKTVLESSSQVQAQVTDEVLNGGQRNGRSIVSLLDPDFSSTGLSMSEGS